MTRLMEWSALHKYYQFSHDARTWPVESRFCIRSPRANLVMGALLLTLSTTSTSSFMSAARTPDGGSGQGKGRWCKVLLLPGCFWSLQAGIEVFSCQQAISQADDSSFSASEIAVINSACFDYTTKYAEPCWQTKGRQKWPLICGVHRALVLRLGTHSSCIFFLFYVNRGREHTHTNKSK